MSGDEARKIKAAALLEFEESKAYLVLLRTKAGQYRRMLEMVTHLLSENGREHLGSEEESPVPREKIASEYQSVASAMDLNAILGLDDEVKAAAKRFREAQAVKKSLQF